MADKRKVLTHEHRRIAQASARDFERARSHHDNILVLLDGHTRWERDDGDFCDFDGQEWPCHTFEALAFMYDVRTGERADRKKLAAPVDKAAKDA